MSEGATASADAILLLAVYGTLRPSVDHPDAPRLDRYRQLGHCLIPGTFVNLGNYPGRIPGPGAIGGELVELPDRAAFDELDAYERAIGPAPLFRRELVPLIRPEGTLAWVYTWCGRTEGGRIHTAGAPVI